MVLWVKLTGAAGILPSELCRGHLASRGSFGRVEEGQSLQRLYIQSRGRHGGDIFCETCNRQRPLCTEHGGTARGTAMTSTTRRATQTPECR